MAKRRTGLGIGPSRSLGPKQYGVYPTESIPIADKRVTVSWEYHSPFIL